MLKIGAHGWVKALKAITEPVSSEFWSGFQPASESELREAERQLGRKLDPEFREFYRTIGYGEFPERCGQFQRTGSQPIQSVVCISGDWLPPLMGSVGQIY